MRDGWDPDYYPRLFRLESGNFWFRARNRLILWALEKFFPAARSMLEVGCGTGYVLSGIAIARPAMALTGSEIHEAGLDWTARRVPGARFLQMDARRIPFTSEFDVVGAFDVIEHIEDDRAVLAEIRRALVPGGGLIVTVPQHRLLWSAADEYAYHKRRYTRADLVGKVREAGLRVLLCTSFVSLLLPLAAVSRLRTRTLETFDPEAEFRLPAFANRLLEGVMSVERAAIRAGARWPFGVSLLLVAQTQDG
ncbi:MAG TPA: methyltransferase domain-containing protein [Burkholderiales bacterium]|nr:methyltransferase domain-containing protein [Burkholderiales bacterium]